MNFISGEPEDCISLPKLRDILIRLEDLTNTLRRRLNGWGTTMVMDLKDEYQF